MPDDLTPRDLPAGYENYHTTTVTVIGSDGKPIPQTITRTRYVDAPRDLPPHDHEGLRLLFIPLLVIAFVAGLFVAAQIDRTRPTNPATDPEFVNIDGHQGEILVVGTDGSLRWTTEAELHKAAGHG